MTRRRFQAYGALGLVWSLVAGAASVWAAAESRPPTVFWASDPVRPGDAVLVTGDGLTSDCAVELFRLADGPAGQPQAISWPEEFVKPEVLQPRGQSLKFVLPAELAPGVVAFRVRSGEAVSTMRLLNVPDLWWCQGDAGTAATPGGTMRLFGKNLSWRHSTSVAPDGAEGLPAATVALSGPRSAALAARGDGYNLTVDLPADLPVGEYQGRVHHGRGGPGAWGRPLAIKVIAPPAWPGLTLNVMDFGADGRGLADDTAAIAEALTRLKSAGGGVLYFPRGRYLVSQTMSIPERTVLRGEKRELSAIAWPDAKEPLADLLVGTHSFAIEDLSFYCANYGNFLTVDLKSPQAGNIRLHRLRVVANRYRGHLYDDAEEMSRRFTRFGVHGGKLLALGGENVEVSDCDLLSSGCALFLTRARGARIANNVFRMGRFGWFWLSGSDGVVFENNQCLGQDLSTWGGGINCLDGSTVSQHVYFARNTCSQWFGGDNEMTTDGSGGAYYGKLATAEGTRLATGDEPKWGQRDWRGAAVLVIGGRGVGQCRRVVRTEGRQIEIDRPWDIVPDADSQITITMYQGDYLLLDNRFTDIGVIQFYGMSLSHICAGNTSARTAGFFNMGMNYHHIQPSWYVQWLDNVIEEGNGYDSAHRRLPREAQLGLLGLAPRPDFPYALNLASIARRNRLLSNAGITVGRDERVPSVQDAVVERCYVQDNDWGISVAPGAAGVLLRENQFERVAEPVRDLAQIGQQLEAERQRFAGRCEPLAVWDFADLKGTRLPDRSGHGFHARVNGRLDSVQEEPVGTAARLDGETYLQVGFTRSSGYAYAQAAGLGARHMQQEAFNQRAVTISVWIKPEAVDRRQALVGKRFNETSAPFILSIHEGRIVFEAAEAAGKWAYNVRSPAVVKPGQWQHLAAVIEENKGARLYLNGQEVLRSEAKGKLAANSEPLVIGREAWAANPPDAPRGPTFYRGLMGPIKIWARVLSAEEIAADGMSFPTWCHGR